MDDPTPDPQRPTPSVRASDAEREATARALQESYTEGRLTLAEFDERTAAAYGARFRHELIELTHDLPLARRELESALEIRAERAPVRRVTGGDGPSTSIALMSGVERRGSWTLPAEHTALALMGGVQIDLRRAALQSHESVIRAFAIMGGIEILVPDDVHVEIDGIGVMGAFAEEVGPWKSDPRPVRQAPPGAPVVRITGLALMGGVEIRRVPRAQD